MTQPRSDQAVPGFKGATKGPYKLKAPLVARLLQLYWRVAKPVARVASRPVSCSGVQAEDELEMESPLFSSHV